VAAGGAPSVFRKVPEVLQIGRFSAAPTIEDLQGLTWEASDIDALRRRTPGQCDVKIGVAGLERLKEINWSAWPGGRFPEPGLTSSACQRT
jgi:hypothetical protein